MSKRGKKIGRPTKYTPEIAERIATRVAMGNYRETAAAAEGIAKSTFFEWLDRYSDFSDLIEKADAQAEGKRVKTILQAADGGKWQAAAWYLERKCFDRWGRKDRHELTGKDGGGIKYEVEFVGVSTDMVEVGIEGDGQV